jgi:hypothetical protein
MTADQLFSVLNLVAMAAVLTFLFGPAGWLLYLATRSVSSTAGPVSGGRSLTM